MCHTRLEFGDHVNDENYTMAECNGMSKIIHFRRIQSCQSQTSTKGK